MHSHPGSDGVYIVNGEFAMRTPDGVLRVGVGQAATAPAAGTPMQVTSSGATDLRGLVMFVVDANRAFAAPATLP